MPAKPKANADPEQDAKNPDNPLGDVPVEGVLPMAPLMPKPPKSYSESIPSSTLIYIPVLFCMIGMDGQISRGISMNVA